MQRSDRRQAGVTGISGITRKRGKEKGLDLCHRNAASPRSSAASFPLARSCFEVRAKKRAGEKDGKAAAASVFALDGRAFRATTRRRCSFRQVREPQAF